MVFDTQQPTSQPDKKTSIEKLDRAQELSGKLQRQTEEDKLMHSVLENDKTTIKEGKVIEQAMNQGVSSFVPDLLFDNLVRNYKHAKKMYGETILRELCGYDPDYIGKNIRIPEFRKVLKKQIKDKAKKMQQDGLLDKQFGITEQGIELAMLVMYAEELDNITPKGMQGERLHKKISHYGGKEDHRLYKKGDRYRDIALKKSVKTAIRRGHNRLETNDLKVYERQSKGQCNIIYALDASGSMKGKKIGTAKKAGIALAHNAIKNKDKVGLIVFGQDILDIVEPTLDFPRLLRKIVTIKATKQTNIAKTINKAVSMFANDDSTKHLLFISDALPTTSIKSNEDPKKKTLDAAAIAANQNITISLVGINLDDRGKKLAEELVDIGKGKLYVVKDLEHVDKIILEDYYRVA